MESAKKITLSQKAFVTSLLHACKHVTTPVYGVLLAEPLKDNSVLRIVESVPLFHETPMAPLLEVAMTMISKECATSGLIPVGIYFGSDHYQEDKTYPHAEAVASNLGGRGTAIKNPLLAVIRTSELANGDEGQPFEVFECHGSAFKVVTSSKFSVEHLNEANKQITNILSKGEQLKIVDFNDHIITTEPWLEL
jgi:hypothetical protein